MEPAGPSCGQIAGPRESGQSDYVCYTQDTCPVCIPVQMCLLVRTLYTEVVSRFLLICLNMQLAGVMKYSWPYNFVLYAFCDVEPVKGFEISDIDLSVPQTIQHCELNSNFMHNTDIET